MLVRDILENAEMASEFDSWPKEFATEKSLRFRWRYYYDIVMRVMIRYTVTRRDKGDATEKNPIVKKGNDWLVFWSGREHAIPDTPKNQQDIHLVKTYLPKYLKLTLRSKAAQKAVKQFFMNKQNSYQRPTVKLPPEVMLIGRSKKIQIPDPYHSARATRKPYYGPPENFGWFNHEDAHIYRTLSTVLAHYGFKFTTVISDGGHFVALSDPDPSKALIVWRVKPQQMASKLEDVYINGEKFSPQRIIEYWKNPEKSDREHREYKLKGKSPGQALKEISKR